MKNPGNFTPLGRKRFAGSELEEPEAMADGDRSEVRGPRGEWHRGPCSWGHGMRQLAWGRRADNLPPRTFPSPGRTTLKAAGNTMDSIHLMVLPSFLNHRDRPSPSSELRVPTWSRAHFLPPAWAPLPFTNARGAQDA